MEPAGLIELVVAIFADVANLGVVAKDELCRVMPVYCRLADQWLRVLCCFVPLSVVNSKRRYGGCVEDVTLLTSFLPFGFGKEVKKVNCWQYQISRGQCPREEQLRLLSSSVEETQI